MTKASAVLVFIAAMLALPLVGLERNPSITMEWFRTYTNTNAHNDGSSMLTGISVGSETEIEVELEIMEFDFRSVVFCACGSSDSDRAYMLIHAADGTWQFKYGSTTYSGGISKSGKRHIVRTSPHGLYIDGEKVATPTAVQFSAPGFLRLFSAHTYNEGAREYSINRWGCANARFHSFKIYERDSNGDLVLMHDIRGCRTTNGANSVYDAITGTVFMDENADSVKWYPIGGPYVVSAPGGTGDVVALTNAVACASTLGERHYDKMVLLEPGTYRFDGVAMKPAESHLNIGGAFLLAGKGASRDDTLLIGAGEAGGCRVIKFDGVSGTVSNLTVTGGYMPMDDNGGGIASDTRYGRGTVVDCVISNNYAKGSTGHGGGGLWGISEVRRCAIVGNATDRVGGGCGACSTIEDCTIVDNVAGTGAGISGGTVSRSRIAGNRAKNDGGGLHSSVAADCVIVGNDCHNGGNYGRGGGMANCVATNCVFSGNGDSDNVGGYGSAARSSTLVGCTVADSYGRRSVFDACSLRNCHISSCGASQDSATYPFSLLGRSDGVTTFTNVNCIVENVALSNAADRVAVESTFVNCTIRKAKCIDNGPLAASCKAFNTIIAECEPFDLVGDTSASLLVNCAYVTASGDFAEGQLVDCIRTHSLRWDRKSPTPCSITASSKAYNAGLDAAWLLSLAGDVDFVGNPRVAFGRIDIGAVEAQSDWVPGFRLICR